MMKSAIIASFAAAAERKPATAAIHGLRVAVTLLPAGEEIGRGTYRQSPGVCHLLDVGARGEGLVADR